MDEQPADKPLSRSQRRALKKRQVAAAREAARDPMAGRIKAAKRAAAKTSGKGKSAAANDIQVVRGGLPGLGKKR